MLAELQSGETTLVVGGDGCVQRRLRVVKVVVRPKEVPSAHLETSVQRFPDGRERVRNELLSEKVSRLRRFSVTALQRIQPGLLLTRLSPALDRSASLVCGLLLRKMQRQRLAMGVVRTWTLTLTLTLSL